MRSVADCGPTALATGRGGLFGRRALSAGIAIAASLSGCAKTAPAAPDPQPGLVGTWTGTITSDVLGPAPATITIEPQIGPAAAPFMNGKWRFAFPNPAFDADGQLSATLAGDIVGIFFSRTAVPCPGEPDGIAQKAIFASMRLDAGRMHGDYIAAGCPGGTMDLNSADLTRRTSFASRSGF